MRIGAAHKKKFEAWLAAHFELAGIAGPEALARHIVLLMDGALTTMHRDPAYAEAAAEAARSLVQLLNEFDARRCPDRRSGQPLKSRKRFAFLLNML